MTLPPRRVRPGLPVLLTTRMRQKADQPTERHAVIEHDRAIADGTVAELTERSGSGVLRLTPRDAAAAELAARIDQLSGLIPCPEVARGPIALPDRVVRPEDRHAILPAERHLPG